jgi:hypothetical protein
VQLQLVLALSLLDDEGPDGASIRLQLTMLNSVSGIPELHNKAATTMGSTEHTMLETNDIKSLDVLHPIVHVQLKLIKIGNYSQTQFFLLFFVSALLLSHQQACALS